MDRRSSSQQRILLGQLGSYGDCLYATTVARQVKQDHPDSILTWAVGSMYADVLDQNPHVDRVWKYPVERRNDLLDGWAGFVRAVDRKLAAGEFDQVLLTQVFPGNLQNFDGTLRSSIFRAYGRPITVPVDPVVVLRESEISRVRSFVESHGLADASDVLLFECEASSGQSRLNLETAMEIARELISRKAGLRIILSSSRPVDSGHPGIIDGSSLSFRENVRLSHYCSLLLGVSSGISWISTSGSAKKLPMIQVLNRDLSYYASMKTDHAYFGLPTDHIIEMADDDPARVIGCCLASLDQGHERARARYDQATPVSHVFYFDCLRNHVRNGGNMSDLFRSITITRARFGWSLSFVKDVILKSIKLAIETVVTRGNRGR